MGNFFLYWLPGVFVKEYNRNCQENNEEKDKKGE